MGNWSSKKSETASASTYNVYQPPSNAQSSSNVTTASSGNYSGHSNNTAQTTASNIFQSSPQPPSITRSSSSVTTASAATHSVHSYNTSRTTASNVQTSQVPVYVTVQRDIPVKAQQIIKHSANSYIIPKLQQSERWQQQEINNPFSSLPDKFGLRICPQYNSKTGCRAEICRRLHVCLYQVMKKCNKDNCEKDHSFTSNHNNMILKIFWRRRDFNINLLTEILQNNHKAKKNTKQEQNDCICLYNIMRKCNRKPCSQIHSKKSYQWEVKNNAGKWLQFSYKQSDYLESIYCDPSQDSVELLPLPSELLNHKPFHALKCLLAQGQSWEVDMERMKLFAGSLSYCIRRLSTPSDITSDFHMACRWIWYWQDDDNLWKPYTDGTRKFFIVALSDQLEYHLHFGHGTFNVTLGTHTYVIDTQDMIQKNTETGKIRTVRRRPVCTIFEDKVTSFDKMFSTLPSDKRYMLFPVLPSTSEFVFIEKMIKNTLPMANLKIQRIQNDHLWNAYQNKKSQLLALYNDLSLVNEQYLFHGTKHSVIDQICCENLDWRLYGSNVGNVYGRGTYFSNKASLSDSYSETNNLNQKALFVIYVLVGTMTVGNSGMTLPPTNPETGRCFDTTCNDKLKSEIFVKYNRDEYYPAYIVKYYKPTCQY